MSEDLKDDDELLLSAIKQNASLIDDEIKAKFEQYKLKTKLKNMLKNRDVLKNCLKKYGDLLE